MSAVAEHMLFDRSPPAEPQWHRLTVAEYGLMGKYGILPAEQRTELLAGRVFDMAPISPGHAYWVDRLNRYFSKRLPDEIGVRVQNPLYLDDYTEPQPDIALLKPRELSYASAHPKANDVLLVIEVAQSSLAFDRTVKLPLYAQHAIPELWIIDVTSAQLAVYRQPVAAEYQLVCKPALGETLSLMALPDFKVDLSSLFQGI